MVDKIFINLQPRVVVNMLGICAVKWREGRRNKEWSAWVGNNVGQFR